MTEHKATGAVFIWQRMCHILKSNTRDCVLYFRLSCYTRPEGPWQQRSCCLNSERYCFTCFAWLLSLEVLQRECP